MGTPSRDVEVSSLERRLLLYQLVQVLLDRGQ